MHAWEEAQKCLSKQLLPAFRLRFKKSDFILFVRICSLTLIEADPISTTQFLSNLHEITSCLLGRKSLDKELT